MRDFRMRRMVTSLGTGMAAVALVIAGAASVRAQQAPADTAVYIVQVAGAPLAAYTGGVAGIPATRPADGAKLRTSSRDHQAYRQHLRTGQATVLRRAGLDAKKKITEYSTVFNGFAAKLTAAEVAALRRTPGVARVYDNEIHRTETVSTPSFLGLDGAGGVWERHYGDAARAGEGVIVGVIDQGIWPEHPSFAALPEPRPDQAAIDAKWSGTCQSGDDHPVTCNNKVIGARFYDATNVAKHAAEFRSPRDRGGHGTLTAGTAVGNHGVTATVNGVEQGSVSGMAPAARLAVYKAEWMTPDGSTSTGTTVDLVDAIDDAVADGVDVIDYSLSGGSTLDPVEIAFLNATAAGVFVAASGGNGGLRPGQPGGIHSFPWDMTVAASTHGRSFTRTVTLGNGASFTGAGSGPASGQVALVDSANAAAPGANPTDAELCVGGALDPAKVRGRIVLCRRGVTGRIQKSQAVKEAGGVGMILYNAAPGSLDADFHFVSTIHVDEAAGPAIKAYIAGADNPTATLSAARQVTGRAPEIASISSHGPARSGGGDLLKPDITAPGQDVLTAFSPAVDGSTFGSFTGTSLSSPHIAGLAALVRGRNPSWSPMAVKSALMTTAGQLDNTGRPIQRNGVNATPLDFGAGHVRPGSAFDPGLVYESGPTDWMRYLCGIGERLAFSDGNGGTVDGCPVVGSIDPSDLNYPSIAVGDLTGKQTVTRTVTNVTNRASVYVARVQAPPGISVTVTPSTLVVRPRESVSFTVQITRTSAAFGAWAFGSLEWSDLRGHNVRSPIAVRPVVVAAPATSAQSGANGSVVLPVRAGYTGTLTASAFGLVPSEVTSRHLVGTETRFDRTNPVVNPAVGKVTVNVPEGAKLARFATFAADLAPGTDIDLFAFRAGTSTLVGSSASGGGQESVVVVSPGAYDIYLVQFGLPTGVTEQDVRLHVSIVGPTPAGNLTVRPASQRVTLGQATGVTVTWTGLTAGQHYIGTVEYGDGAATLGQTVLVVDP